MYSRSLPPGRGTRTENLQKQRILYWTWLSRHATCILPKITVQNLSFEWEGELPRHMNSKFKNPTKQCKRIVSPRRAELGIEPKTTYKRWYYPKHVFYHWTIRPVTCGWCSYLGRHPSPNSVWWSFSCLSESRKWRKFVGWGGDLWKGRIELHEREQRRELLWLNLDGRKLGCLEEDYANIFVVGKDHECGWGRTK